MGKRLTSGHRHVRKPEHLKISYVFERFANGYARHSADQTEAVPCYLWTREPREE
jgi:hypothetical protein